MTELDERRGPLFGGTIRGIPGHHWIRLFVGRVRHPGHRWMYSGIVRRDTFTVAGWGVILMRMPRRRRGVCAENIQGCTLRRSHRHTPIRVRERPARLRLV